MNFFYLKLVYLTNFMTKNFFKESYFPNGLEGMYQELGSKPIIAHNRW